MSGTLTNPVRFTHPLLETNADREIVIKGSRIHAEHVLERYVVRKQSASEIAEDLRLSSEKVDAVLAFLREQPAEASAYLNEFIRKRNEFEAKLEREQPVGLKQRLMERLRAKEQANGAAPAR